MKRALLVFFLAFDIVGASVLGFVYGQSLDSAQIAQLNAEITGLKTQVQQAPIPVRDGDTWAVLQSINDDGYTRTIEFEISSYNFAERDSWLEKKMAMGFTIVGNYMSQKPAADLLESSMAGAMNLYRDAPGAWKQLPKKIDIVVIYNSGNAFYRIDRSTRTVIDLR